MQAETTDELCDRVAEVWRASGRTPGTIYQYLLWVRRFRGAFVGNAALNGALLTRDHVDAFVAKYVAQRSCKGTLAREGARNALRAWSCALHTLGFAVPPWVVPIPPPVLPPLIAEFVAFRLRHGGVAPRTAQLEARYASQLVTFIRKRRRRVSTLRLIDIDAFVAKCCSEKSLKTVEGICSALRAFLRYCLAVGRLRHDLASSVAAPRVRRRAHPPRALPWRDVRRLLNAIDTESRIGRRDYAMLLTMASYGMGAGEVLSLRLDNIDWQARILRIYRPKTGVTIELPLLDAVACALADYLQDGRPRYTEAREVFVSYAIPFRRLTAASAIRHRLVKYAATAGLTPSFIGSHVLRHSHACRQTETGAPPKVLSDILGHSRPSSTSAYVSVAIDQLRRIALPVPT